MKQRRPATKKQSGVALILFLVALILAAGYAFYRSSNIGAARNESNAALIATLAKAKEALIAYAIIDANRPGRLLCPDLLDSGVSPILSRDDCDAYIGWLPWKTLDLKDATDDHGTKFRYVALRWFGGDRAKPPLNSDTLSVSQLADAGIQKTTLDSTSLGTLYLDIPVGSGTDAIDPLTDPKNEIVALIIAPRGELDPRNADGDNYFFSGKSSDTDNDLIMPVTRQELMAAVEKRVANEVKACVQNHASAANNSKKRFPWPAPLSATDYQGKAGSLFGQLPLTQPSPSANSLLNDAAASLNGNIDDFKNTDPNDYAALLAVTGTLNATLSQIRNLLDSLYIAATKLWQAATVVSKSLGVVNLTAETALQPSGSRRTIRISNSELTDIQTESTNVLVDIDRLPTQLDASGLDIYPEELAARARTFSNAVTAENAQSLEDMLWSTQSTHVDIYPRLQAAQNAASSARVALQTPIQADAAAKATALTNSITCLQAVIAASRINTHYSDISALIAPIQTSLLAYEQSPGTVTAEALRTALASSRTDIAALATVNPQTTGCGTGATAIIAARNTATAAIDTAQLALTEGILAKIQSDTTNAIGKIQVLVTAMVANDDNLTRSSVTAWVAAYRTHSAPLLNIRPLSSTARVPYVENFYIVAVNLENWAKTIAAHAATLASKIKAAPISNDAFYNVSALEGSAYALATEALNSSATAASALTNVINTPTTLKIDQAEQARLALIDDASAFNTEIEQLGGSFSSSTASALPIVWLASQCDAFRQTADAWWRKGAWQDLVFYQISNIDSTLPGNLKVNGDGNYRVVAIASGRTLSSLSQTRPLSPATRTSASYLEKLNSSATRNGDATSPDKEFTNDSPSATFNDRLAY